MVCGIGWFVWFRAGVGFAWVGWSYRHKHRLPTTTGPDPPEYLSEAVAVAKLWRWRS